MKLAEATELFECLREEATRKSEIKMYDQFIGIILDLEDREFTIEEMQSIEVKLDDLDLAANPKNRKKYYRKRLEEFKSYLKDRFSLITEGYYTGIGLALGIAFGAAAGSIYGMENGISLGLIAGLLIGATLDAQAKKQNRVLGL